MRCLLNYFIHYSINTSLNHFHKKLRVKILQCYLIYHKQALIERGDEAAKQPIDDEENTFLHVAARSGALRSIQASDILFHVDTSKL